MRGKYRADEGGGEEEEEEARIRCVADTSPRARIQHRREQDNARRLATIDTLRKFAALSLSPGITGRNPFGGRARPQARPSSHQPDPASRDPGFLGPPLPLSGNVLGCR